MGTIRLLDCTLRDGGHINQGKFGKNVIKSIIDNLVKAKIDIIEAGFLWDSKTDDDTARFDTLDKLKRYLPEDMGKSKISLMADNIDLTRLEPYDGTVEYIRLSFRKNEFDWAEKSAQMLMDKGYKCYINPIHGSLFTDEEYLRIAERVNRINPYGFSIVDTFGALRQADLGRIYYLLEKNLNKNIVLGIHLHENLGLAYSLAQYVLNIASPTRNITIDGSLFGMGKVPGNLCIEQMVDYLNSEYDSNYPIEPVYDAIDQFIIPIRERVSWGYSIPYAISGQCGVHRTYAEYLTAKERLKTKDVRRLLCAISPEHADTYDKQYIEEMYQSYMNVEYDDFASRKKLAEVLDQFQKVIIIAPGASLRDYIFEKSLVQDACVIHVNFVYEKVEPTLLFFSNARRFGCGGGIDYSKLIITSNLLDDAGGAKYIVSRNELSYHNDVYCDDSTMMLLALLKNYGKKKIFIAGFDGFRRDNENFCSELFGRKVRDADYDVEGRKKILREVYAELDITYLTPSMYLE